MNNKDEKTEEDEKDANEILPEIWLGSLDAAIDVNFLHKVGITAILSIIDRKTYRKVVKTEAKKIGIETHLFVCEDESTSKMFNKFNGICAYIDNKTNKTPLKETTTIAIATAAAKTKVLVHCRMGVSRSATAVIAYLMKRFDWSVDKAHQYVKLRRTQICPNRGFIRQLHQWREYLDQKSKIKKTIQP